MPTRKVLLDSSCMAIRAHVCPKFLGPKILARITTSLVGWELHAFVGVNCDHVDKVVDKRPQVSAQRMRVAESETRSEQRRGLG
jgi:hypothetical protein